MVNKLINYCIEKLDNEEIRYTFSKMCMKRCDLPRTNYELYNDLENLLVDFLDDNELTEEWFETEVGLVEDLFDCIIKNLD